MLPCHSAKTDHNVIPIVDFMMLQSAHDIASKILGLPRKNLPFDDGLGNQIFRLFDLGHRDPAIIGAIAAQRERGQER